MMASEIPPIQVVDLSAAERLRCCLMTKEISNHVVLSLNPEWPGNCRVRKVRIPVEPETHRNSRVTTTCSMVTRRNLLSATRNSRSVRSCYDRSLHQIAALPRHPEGKNLGLAGSDRSFRRHCQPLPSPSGVDNEYPDSGSDEMSI